MFKNIGKYSGGATGSLSDRLVNLAAEQFSHASKLDQLDTAITELRAKPEPVYAAPAEDHSQLYIAVADLQTESVRIADKLDAMNIPDVAPIYTFMADFDSRLKFNEKAAMEQNKKTFKAVAETLDARIRAHEARLAQSDEFRLKSITDQNRKIQRLHRIIIGLSITLFITCIYLVVK